MTHLDDIVALRRPKLRLQDHLERLAARSHLRMLVHQMLVVNLSVHIDEFAAW